MCLPPLWTKSCPLHTSIFDLQPLQVASKPLLLMWAYSSTFCFSIWSQAQWFYASLGYPCKIKCVLLYPHNSWLRFWSQCWNNPLHEFLLLDYPPGETRLCLDHIQVQSRVWNSACWINMWLINIHLVNKQQLLCCYDVPCSFFQVLFLQDNRFRCLVRIQLNRTLSGVKTAANERLALN